MIKLFQPYVAPKAAKYVTDVLNSGQLAEGPRVKEFEEKFSTVFHKRNVVAVNSGTSALELAYHIAGIQKGDEVITPVLTCTATNVPLLRRGAKIVWGDIHPTELTLSFEDLERKVTTDTKAVVYVHFAGNNYNLRKIAKLCKDRKVTLIEDAAQALGSTYWGVGDHTAVSLQAIKTLTTGDGGVYLGAQYTKARRLRWFGYDRDEKQRLGDIDLLEAGYKFHMNDIAAAIGLANLEKWDSIQTHKKKIGAIYRDGGLHVGAWLTWGFTDDLEGLKKAAKCAGFEVGQHHYRNDKYTVFGKRKKLPNMDAIENRFFFVPSHTGVRISDARNILKTCSPFLTQ